MVLKCINSVWAERVYTIICARLTKEQDKKNEQKYCVSLSLSLSLCLSFSLSLDQPKHIAWLFFLIPIFLNIVTPKGCSFYGHTKPFSTIQLLK